MEIVIPQSREAFPEFFEYLDITKRAAEAFGNTVTVLEPFPCPMVDEFRTIYRHKSPNPPHFERWCFETWFLIAKWMKDNGKKVIFRMDSDCLVFADMERVYEQIGRPMCTVPTSDSFLTLTAAQSAANFILTAFRQNRAHEFCAPGHVSDIHMLSYLSRELWCKDLLGWSNDSIVDTNLYGVYEEDAFEGHKDIWFVNGQPAWRRKSGGYVRMLTVHCWGKAKKKMPEIWAQAQRSITEGVPMRLTIGE